MNDPLCYERELWACGAENIAGVDEAGRGPLAGPVVAAAVVFPRGLVLPGVDDSKKLSGTQREALFGMIHASAIAVGVGTVDHDEIDRINILQATYRAMHAAVAALGVRPGHLLIDGNRFAGVGIPFTVIVDGDARCHAIAAASIIAKVTRDRMMLEYDRMFPGYGFAQHKGYGTLHHRTAIASRGICPIHRRSFLSRITVAHAPDGGVL